MSEFFFIFFYVLQVESHSDTIGFWSLRMLKDGIIDSFSFYLTPQLNVL
jgi:hypothetical protein